MKKFFQTICLSLLVAHIWAQDAKIAIEQPVYLNKDTVSGTLVSQFPLDSRKIKKQPLVIFIAGSGPTDRDGNSAFLDGKNDAYKQLADILIHL
ncbi:MAG: hypothetical protein U5L96_09950 [Owenweeksia sp.]|nr:hypothetical protein [Owenweeksia sp.]